MRTLGVVLLAALGCGDRGIAVDLTVEPDCQGAASRIRSVRFDVDARPVVSKSSFNLLGANLFASLGQSNRVVLLLPDDTRRVNVRATALDATSATIGSGATGDIFFNAPVRRPITMVLHEPDCTMPIGDLGGGTDLPPGTDLARTFSVTGAVAQGAFPSGVFEAEGNQQPPASGVAVLITGSGLHSGASVASNYGIPGPSYVGASGTRIATSLQLPVDSMLAAGSIQQVTLTITQDGAAVTTKFAVQGLGELSVGSAQTTPLASSQNTPSMFSSASVEGTLQLGGSNRGFLWVTGPLTGSGTILALPSAGGKPGCTSAACDDTINGQGHGQNGALHANGGGGASYGTSGSAGATGGGANGTTYGVPSLIGLVSGSGGGAGGGSSSIGGTGGGVLRVRAGRITDVNFHADGEDGKTTAPGDTGGGGGGGGSGGALLVQSVTGLSASTPRALSTAGGMGGVGMVDGTRGGNGGAGRVRVDIGVAGSPTADYVPTPVLGFGGLMVAADWPSAWGAPPADVRVMCGSSVLFTVEVDGTPRSAIVACNSSSIETAPTPVAFSPPLTGGGIHRVCARLKVTTNTPAAAYSEPYSEDRDCRAIAIAGD